MRTITVLMIILFIMTVGAQEIGSPVSKIRQKRAWVVEIFTMKRGFKGLLGHVSFFVNNEDCKIYGPGYDQEPKGIFSINNTTKEMHVIRTVEYDKKNYMLVFECASLAHVFERLAVDVLIEEIYEPYFSNGTYFISAEESMLQGTNLLTMHAPNSIDNEILTFNVKVTPNPHNVMFVINEKREISFRGCLDYEENKKYTLVVEAKDQKALTPHSSTATVIINVIDKNDQQPVITGKNGSGLIKERETGVVYRIQVTDRDSPGSPGWRAKYTLYGEKAENFKIESNPQTNEGILSVVKPLDYEETQKLNLTVHVENEEPFFSCSVQKKHYDGKLWDVNYSRNGSNFAMIYFPITVEDVNDPPVFTDTVKHVTIMENTPPGHSLWTFTVTDQDQNPPNKHRFIIGKDLNFLVTIDSRSGKVSTAKVLDRESQFIKNSTYTVILHAVDDGTPQQTGTATLIIHLLDENDNAPLLKDNKVTICSSESMTNITAVDPDLPPFTTPFIYELEDNKGEWKIEPSIGETVNLVKGSKVFPGIYELILNIIDSGGLSSRQKLSVIVYNCTDHGKSSTILAAIISSLICLLLMLCALLMVFKCSCSSNTAQEIPSHDFEDSKLHHYNDEGPGSDVEIKVQQLARPQYNKLDGIAKQREMKWTYSKNSWQMNEEAWMKKCTIYDDSLSQIWTMMNTMIEKKLFSLQDKGNELCDYQPHPYNNEGEPEDLAQLDRISIADSHFSLGDLQNLDSKFQQLEEQCRPDLIQQIYVSQASSAAASSLNH